jgi:hypothetical protein
LFKTTTHTKNSPKFRGVFVFLQGRNLREGRKLRELGGEEERRKRV